MDPSNEARLTTDPPVRDLLNLRLRTTLGEIIVAPGPKYTIVVVHNPNQVEEETAKTDGDEKKKDGDDDDDMD